MDIERYIHVPGKNLALSGIIMSLDVISFPGPTSTDVGLISNIVRDYKVSPKSGWGIESHMTYLTLMSGLGKEGWFSSAELSMTASHAVGFEAFGEHFN